MSALSRVELYRGFGRLALGVLAKLPSSADWVSRREIPLVKEAPIFWKAPARDSLAGIVRRSGTFASEGQKLCWFHAASAGELEALWPVIARWMEDSGRAAVVSILSDSARKALLKLETELRSLGRPLQGVAFSPLEGHWREALARVKPDLFVSFKYEAWPDLWASLSELRIPLALVGARERTSLRFAREALKVMGGELPRMALLSSTQEELERLRPSFPAAEIIECTGEPRWDRVAARARSGSERAKELIVAASGAPRPWGVLGSAWLDDLKMLSEQLTDAAGRLWVVPHDVQPASVAAFEVELSKLGLRPTRTSRISAVDPLPKGCFLVDEMGVLAELYSAMDWVYVGGGFTQGVHSTIEPALYGLPILVGPKNADRFPEIAELERSGQLQIARSAEGLARAWAEVQEQALTGRNRERWRAEAQARLGASERVIGHLLKLLKLCEPVVS